MTAKQKTLSAVVPAVETEAWGSGQWSNFTAEIDRELEIISQERLKLDEQLAASPNASQLEKLLDSSAHNASAIDRLTRRRAAAVVQHKGALKRENEQSRAESLAAAEPIFASSKITASRIDQLFGELEREFQSLRSAGIEVLALGVSPGRLKHFARRNVFANCAAAHQGLSEFMILPLSGVKIKSLASFLGAAGSEVALSDHAANPIGPEKADSVEGFAFEEESAPFTN